MPYRTFIVAALLAALVAFAAACDDDGDGTPTVEPTSTSEATEPAPATPTAGETGEPSGIREEDLTTQPTLLSYLDASNGEVSGERIVYADLTEDGAEEGILPVSSGGEGGDIALFVFGMADGTVEELLRVTSDRLAFDVEEGALVVTEPVFAAGDPQCCPSQLQRTTYRWDGSAISVAEQETVPAEGT
jgi:hypothetical protein